MYVKKIKMTKQNTAHRKYGSSPFRSESKNVSGMPYTARL